MTTTDPTIAPPAEPIDTADAAAAEFPDVGWSADRWVEEMLEAEGLLEQRTDEQYADWYVNKLLAQKAEITRIKLQAEHRVRQAEARMEALVTSHSKAVGEAVARLLEARNKGKQAPAKSIDLPSGRAGFRALPVTAEFADPKSVQAFAESFGPAADVYGEETKVVPKIDKKGLKLAVDQFAAENGGELPAGIELAGGGERFYVDPPRAK